ncbi:MAG TPA: hypothetical protein VND64_34925 [Pirellulales bacterium]|nr:hypothetical protein [Pirellulales bacterium]
MTRKLPRHAKRLDSAGELYARLERFHGIDPELASERLHEVKEEQGYGAADNVIFDFTGNLYDPESLEWIGSLTEGGAKK